MHLAQAALSSQLPSAAAGTSAVVLAALRDAYPAEVMNLASNLDMNVRPAIPSCALAHSLLAACAHHHTGALDARFAPSICARGDA